MQSQAGGLFFKFGTETAMGQDKQRSSKGQAAADRKQRLEQALRENLKKRKHQAHARKAKDAGSGPKAGQT